MTVTIEQFFEAVEKQKDARKQMRHCKKEDVTKILEIEQRGDEAWDVITTYAREKRARLQNSKAHTPAGDEGE